MNAYEEGQKHYTITLRWNGERYEGAIPEVQAEVFGATVAEVLHAAEVVISAYEYAHSENGELPPEEEDDEDIVQELSEKLGFDVRNLKALMEWWQSLPIGLDERHGKIVNFYVKDEISHDG